MCKLENCKWIADKGGRKEAYAAFRMPVILEFNMNGGGHMLPLWRIKYCFLCIF